MLKSRGVGAPEPASVVTQSVVTQSVVTQSVVSQDQLQEEPEPLNNEGINC